MSSIASQIISGAAALRSGGDVTAAVSGGTSSPSFGLADDEVMTTGEENTSPLLPAGMQDSPGDEPETSEDAQTETDESAADPEAKEAKAGKPGDSKKDTGTKKRLSVDKGTKFIEVDYSNRDAVDKAFLMAHGFRKMQVERDSARKEMTTLKEQHTPLKKHWDSLEQAYSAKGVEGVIDLLEGQPGAYKKHINQRLQEHDYLRDATPEERLAYEAKKATESHNKELERIRKENDDFRRQMSEERDASERKALESRLHPAFERVRFKGKLNSADDEHLFDEMLWTAAVKRLTPYEEKGLEITPEMAEKEFASVAKALRGRMAAQAEKQAARSVEKKKEQATEHAQSRVRSGYKGSEDAKEAMGLIDSGNLTSLLKGWGKYGKIFSK